MSFKAITVFHSTFPIRLTVTRWHILPSRGSCHYWVYSKTYEVRGYFFEERELLKAVSLEKIVVYNEEKERESGANWGVYIVLVLKLTGWHRPKLSIPILALGWSKL